MMIVSYSPIREAAVAFLAAVTAVQSIGVNYGTLGHNLPPPAQVAQFLKGKTTIDRIKIFDVNPDILRAFANTGILVAVAVAVPNGEIPALTNVQEARCWSTPTSNPSTPNEYQLHPRRQRNYPLGPQNLIDNLFEAMKSIHKALHLEQLNDISVTTMHSLEILEPTDFPSLARFRQGWDIGVLAPMLEFHRETKSPFMVNPYPYFAYTPENADLGLFRPNQGVFDKYTRRTYGNKFDILLDSVYISMKKLGYEDVEIAVGETGWPSQGEVSEQPKCSVANAASYNEGLVKHYNSGRGTPLMPKTKFETYIFALFNENQKPGSLAERNFGFSTRILLCV